MKVLKNTGKGRDGIALVAVLGLLSVLLLLAITFAVSMRTSQQATRNYVDVVKARHLTQAALAQITSDINTEMAGVMYPALDIWKSIGSGSVNLGGGATDDYLPASFLPADLDNAEWVDLDDANGVLVGRYAYVVANCSGLLDVNQADRISRSVGTNGFEVQLDGMADFTGTDPTIFLTDASGGRPGWVRFETLAEVFSANGIVNASADSLFTYSRFPVGYYDGSQAAEAVLVKSLTDIQANQAAIEAAIANLNAAEANSFYLNLVDYADATRVPGNLSSFCTEAVPLINEIHITNTITSTSAVAPDYNNRWDITVEFWYPFTQPLGLLGLDLNVDITANGGTAPFFSDSGSLNVSRAWSLGDYHVVNLSMSKSHITGASPSLPTSINVDLRWRAGAAEIDKLDVFTVPWGGNFASPIPIQDGFSQNNGEVQREVDDPRINWDWNTHWVNGGTSLGAENSIVTYAAAGNDGTWIMHVADQELYSAGELGYLLYDSALPWKTVRFLDPDPDNSARVLDWFTVQTNTWLPGLVNMNTPDSEVLRAAFLGLDATRAPGDTATNQLDATEALNIANAIIAGRPFSNRSDLNAVLSSTIAGALGGDDMLAEGAIRDSIELLSPRQNLFTVVLLVQAGKDVGGSFVDLAEQKAVAVLWRDPYEDTSNFHPYMTRYFKWMYD